MPFKTFDPANAGQASPLPGCDFALVHLRDGGPKWFRLERPVLYESPDGTVETIDPGILGDTDLTSVPPQLFWFIPSYGRHTLPALLHDYKLTTLPVGDARMAARQAADDQFLETLAGEDVPWLQRRVMWSAVTFWSRLSTGSWWNPRRVLMFLWVACALAGTGLFGWGVATGTTWMWLLGALAPIPAGMLWLQRWLAAWFFAYTAVLLAAALIVVWVTAAVWHVASWGVGLVGRKGDYTGPVLPAP